MKLSPVSTTVMPGAPVAGVKELMSGAGITVKLVLDSPVPTTVVMPIGPVDAPLGTVAVICVAEFTVNVGALVPLNITCETAEKLVPVITTTVPIAPVVGVKLLITGGGPTTNAVAEVAVPVGAVTVIVPVVAPAGTVTVSCVAEATVNAVATVPLKLTAVVPVKFEPRMVTTVPARPPVGEKLVMVGPTAGGLMVKLASEISKK